MILWQTTPTEWTILNFTFVHEELGYVNEEIDLPHKRLLSILSLNLFTKIRTNNVVETYINFPVLDL